MLDSSPAVRDAALELVGKYVVARPDLVAEYLPKICARTNVSSFVPLSRSESDDCVVGHWSGSSSKSREAIEGDLSRLDRSRCASRDLSTTCLESSGRGRWDQSTFIALSLFVQPTDRTHRNWRST